MKRVCLFIVFLLLACSQVVAQDYLRGDLFVGYSYLNSQTNGLSPSRQNFTGWESSYSMNLNPRLAGEADFGGYYRTIAVLGLPGTGSNSIDVAVHDYSFLAGPRLNFGMMFLHALFGIDHLSGTGSGFARSDNNFATAIGGGVQWNLSRYFALRTSADYLLTHHNIFGTAATQQNNLRASLGLVYQFGVPSSPGEVSRRPVRPALPKPAPPGLVTIPQLSVVAKTQKTGAELVEVGPSGLGARTGLQSGDVINAIDGVPIQTATELAKELSNKAMGSSVRIRYLIHGYWQTETVLTLQPSQ